MDSRVLKGGPRDQVLFFGLRINPLAHGQVNGTACRSLLDGPLIACAVRALVVVAEDQWRAFC